MNEIEKTAFLPEIEKYAKQRAENDFKRLKQNRIPLTPEERKIVIQRGAVWHHEPNGGVVPAVWKAKNSKGEIRYCCNTHRAAAVENSLKKAINKFKFIKTTS